MSDTPEIPEQVNMLHNTALRKIFNTTRAVGGMPTGEIPSHIAFTNVLLSNTVLKNSTTTLNM